MPPILLQHACYSIDDRGESVACKRAWPERWTRIGPRPGSVSGLDRSAAAWPVSHPQLFVRPRRAVRVPVPG